MSRAINGNPQLSTIISIAFNLNVSLSEIFEETTNLHSMIVYDGVTYIADDFDTLVHHFKDICIKEGKDFHKL